MIKAIGLGLFVAIVAVALGIRSKPLQADDQVDCSKLQRWKYNRIYNQGDLVAMPRIGDVSTEYKCKDTQCGDQPPSSSWDRVAECKPGTTPK